MTNAVTRYWLSKRGRVHKVVRSGPAVLSDERCNRDDSNHEEFEEPPKGFPWCKFCMGNRFPS